MTMQQIETALAVVGAVGVLCSTLGVVLPSAWRLTQVLRIIGTDVALLLGRAKSGP